MKVTGIAIVPPTAAAENPKVTPELLASSLARYSRSNKGITEILATIDWNNPDKAVDAIFKFVDYGHASIAGLTGGIAIAIDGCSSVLAYKLFEHAQLSDGQESSSRYIQLDQSVIGEPAEFGIPSGLHGQWREVMVEAFELYQQLYSDLDKQAQADPACVRAPANTPPKVLDRMRKNYALDRARYLLPFAYRSNVALVMTARCWAQLVRELDSMPLVEARELASGLRGELNKFAPRLTKHSYRDEACQAQYLQELTFQKRWIAKNGVNLTSTPDKVEVTVERSRAKFNPTMQSFVDGFEGRTNRYSVLGDEVRRMFVRFAWNNVALAELRDLNRHRSGYRYAPLLPNGFYLPPEVSRSRVDPTLQRVGALVTALAADSNQSGAFLYGYLLGIQTPFEHSTHCDKFIYEAELRTGLGAHFRYAEHLRIAAEAFLEQVPEAKEFIRLGEAEPE